MSISMTSMFLGQWHPTICNVYVHYDHGSVALHVWLRILFWVRIWCNVYVHHDHGSVALHVWLRILFWVRIWLCLYLWWSWSWVYFVFLWPPRSLTIAPQLWLCCYGIYSIGEGILVSFFYDYHDGGYIEPICYVLFVFIIWTAPMVYKAIGYICTQQSWHALMLKLH